MATRYRWDDFVLDLDSYRLERAGVPLSLEPKAFNLLALMVQRPGHLFTKQEIFEALWADTAVTDHALTRVVAQLSACSATTPARRAIWKRFRRVVIGGSRRRRRSKARSRPKAAEPAVAAAGRESGRPTAVLSAAIVPGLTAAFALGLVALAFLFWAATAGSHNRRRDCRQPLDAGMSRAIRRWPVQVTTHAGLDMHPAISPHGDAIAFVSDRSGGFELLVRSLGGGSAETPLTSDGGQNVQPAWSPDGKLIAYHSLRHGGIWVIAAQRRHAETDHDDRRAPGLVA